MYRWKHTQHLKLIRSVTYFALSSSYLGDLQGERKTRASSSTWWSCLRSRRNDDFGRQPGNWRRQRSKRAQTIIDLTSRETFRHAWGYTTGVSRQARPWDQLIEQAREIEFTQLIRGARAHALSLSNTLTTHSAPFWHRFLPRTPFSPPPPSLLLPRCRDRAGKRIPSST